MSSTDNVPAVSGADRRIPSSALIEAFTDPETASPFRAVEDARTLAEQAVSRLTEARPRGAGWKQALSDDVDALAAGGQPGRLAELISQDGKRWAEATIAVEHHARLAAKIKQTIDDGGIAIGAAQAAAEAADRWRAEAEAGWKSRADSAIAWQHRRTGEQAWAEWRQANGLLDWVQGTTPDLRRQDAANYRVEDRLPADRAGRGFWLALEMVLQPTQLWRIPDPQAVAWPPDFDDQVFDRLMTGGAISAAYGLGAEVSTRPAGGTRARQ